MVFANVELSVAKGRGGRPKKADGEQPTRHVRVNADLAEMIGWIHHFKNQGDRNVSVAQILDPLLREQIAEMYAPYKAAVEKIKEAEQGATQPHRKPPRKPG